MNEGLLPTRWSRRRFLVGAGVAGGALAATACGGGGGGGDGSGPASTAGAQVTTPMLSDDLALARLGGGLEQMAIDLYDAAVVATADGRLGAVPLALATYLTTARNHHAEHLTEWSGALQAGGLPAVTTADAAIEPTLRKMLSDAKDVAGVVGLIAVVEEILADTYLRSIPTLQDKSSITTAGRILIVDQQHRAIVSYMLGTYPVPEPFQIPDKAAS